MPSENVAASPDRRTRKREARRDHLLNLADDLVERHGVAGVTMSALAEAADYAPASLYTYFPSRSALLAALQQRALVALGGVARDHLARWDVQLSGRGVPPQLAALARLWGFSELFLTAPEHHPREFRLQQQLLVTPGAEETVDAVTVVPAAMSVLEVPHELLRAAVELGVLHAHPGSTDPLGEPLDGEVLRTFAWIVAMNGALMVDSLSTGLPSTGLGLGRELTASLLAGWGASSEHLDAARAEASQLSIDGPRRSPVR